MFLDCPKSPGLFDDAIVTSVQTTTFQRPSQTNSLVGKSDIARGGSRNLGLVSAVIFPTSGNVRAVPALDFPYTCKQRAQISKECASLISYDFSLVWARPCSVRAQVEPPMPFNECSATAADAFIPWRPLRRLLQRRGNPTGRKAWFRSHSVPSSVIHRLLMQDLLP